jgi:hypothetical protein
MQTIVAPQHVLEFDQDQMASDLSNPAQGPQ